MLRADLIKATEEETRKLLQRATSPLLSLTHNELAIIRWELLQIELSPTPPKNLSDYLASLPLKLKNLLNDFYTAHLNAKKILSLSAKHITEDDISKQLKQLGSVQTSEEASRAFALLSTLDEWLSKIEGGETISRLIRTQNTAFNNKESELIKSDLEDETASREIDAQINALALKYISLGASIKNLKPITENNSISSTALENYDKEIKRQENIIASVKAEPDENEKITLAEREEILGYLKDKNISKLEEMHELINAERTSLEKKQKEQDEKLARAYEQIVSAREAKKTLINSCIDDAWKELYPKFHPVIEAANEACIQSTLASLNEYRAVILKSILPVLKKDHDSLLLEYQMSKPTILKTDDKGSRLLCQTLGIDGLAADIAAAIANDRQSLSGKSNNHPAVLALKKLHEVNKVIGALSKGATEEKIANAGKILLNAETQNTLGINRDSAPVRFFKKLLRLITFNSYKGESRGKKVMKNLFSLWSQTPKLENSRAVFTRTRSISSPN